MTIGFTNFSAHQPKVRRARVHSAALNIVLSLILTLVVALIIIGWIILRPEDWKSGCIAGTDKRNACVRAVIIADK
jgi:hypothetical protein